MPVARRPLLVLPSAALLALSLAACTSNPGPAPDTAPPAAGATATSAESPPAAATPDMSATCDAAAAQSFVGKEASELNVAEAKAAAGAKGDVRVIAPGQPVTMDFRADRLNVEVDDGNLITRISCG